MRAAPARVRHGGARAECTARHQRERAVLSPEGTRARRVIKHTREVCAFEGSGALARAVRRGRANQSTDSRVEVEELDEHARALSG